MLSILKLIKSNLKSFVAIIVVGASFGTLNVFQMATLPVRLFSVTTFRKLLFVYAKYCAGICHWWMMSVYKFNPKFNFDKLPDGENALVIANHQAFADIIAIMQLSVILGRPGDLKYFVKDSLKWLPGPGWSLWFYDSIFLKRNWNSDTQVIAKSFEHIKKHELPFLLMTFPEGTRLTAKKLKSSQEFMKSRGMVPFTKCLFPRSKGFEATLSELTNEIDAIYDLTIDYGGRAPSFWNFVSGDFGNYTLTVKRYPFSEIPNKPELQRQWLVERFREKNQILT